MLLATLFLLLQAPPPKVNLAGHVFDSETGRPVGRALLTLRPQRNSDFFLTDLTDAQGRFEFAGVEKGSYFLLSERAGYIKSGYGQKSRFDPMAPIDIPTADG